MPRKKPERPAEPTKSSDLQASGDSILKGIHFDPFEASVYAVDGQIVSHLNICEIATLASGPALLVDRVFTIEGQPDKTTRWSVVLDTDVVMARMTAASTTKRQYWAGVPKDGKILVTMGLEPGETRSFTVLIAAYNPAPKTIKGTLTVEGKFNE